MEILEKKISRNACNGSGEGGERERERERMREKRKIILNKEHCKWMFDTIGIGLHSF